MKTKQQFPTLFLLFFLLITVSGCSQQELIGPKKEFQYSELESLSGNNARIVFYRVKKDKKIDAVGPTVMIDNRVVGALNAYQYISSNVCSGDGEVELRQRTEGAQTLSVKYQAAPQETLYFSVQSVSESQFEATQVEEAQALKDLKKVKHTSYLASRNKAPVCKPVMVAEKKAPTLLKERSVSVDALFRFDSAKLITSQGDTISLLDGLVEELRTEGVLVDSVRIVGHADRLGRSTYNQALSEKRAQAVADYLISKGVQQNLEVVGMGDKQPVTKSCEGSAATAELIKCLQPDRRVSVEFWDIR